jgi:glutathione reductase (NADPH)
MPKQYDLIAIGSGTAASVAASRCRAGGWKVAVVDHLPLGGTCALRGCDPKKVLVGVAEVVDAARRLRGKGIGGGESVIDWRALMAFKRGFTDPVPEMKEKGFAGSGIDVYNGQARFRGPTSIEVGGTLLESRFVLIATGAVPARLGIRGEEHLITSTEFLELDTLPPRIVLVGGGYISTEFSHIAARAGARVTVLQRSDRLLPPFDADLVTWLTEKSRALGIDVRLNAPVASIARTSDGYRVETTSGGRATTFDADIIVHAAGRVPELDALGAHLVGPHVDEVINTFALAVRHGLTATQLRDTMFAYPTGASDVGYML